MACVCHTSMCVDGTFVAMLLFSAPTLSDPNLWLVHSILVRGSSILQLFVPADLISHVQLHLKPDVQAPTLESLWLVLHPLLLTRPTPAAHTRATRCR